TGAGTFVDFSLASDPRCACSAQSRDLFGWRPQRWSKEAPQGIAYRVHSGDWRHLAGALRLLTLDRLRRGSEPQPGPSNGRLGVGSACVCDPGQAALKVIPRAPAKYADQGAISSTKAPS